MHYLYAFCVFLSVLLNTFGNLTVKEMADHEISFYFDFKTLSVWVRTSRPQKNQKICTETFGI